MIFYLKADRLNDGTPRVLEMYKLGDLEGRVDEDIRKQNAVAYKKFINYVKLHKDEVTKKAIEDLENDEANGEFLPEGQRAGERSQESRENASAARQHDVQKIPVNEKEQAQLEAEVELKKRTAGVQKVEIIDPEKEKAKAEKSVKAKKAEKPAKEKAPKKAKSKGK